MTLAKTLFAASVVGVLATACTASPANAGPWSGQWAFKPSRCPDLVEDRRDRRESRRDERVNRGFLDRVEDRLDRRESRRDEKVTTCPASAWVWQGPKTQKIVRPVGAVIYYDPIKRKYFRRGQNTVRVVVW